MATNGISATSQPPFPIFGGDNYEFWSIRMKTLFQSQGLWECIEDGYDGAENDESKKKDAKALFFIQQSLSDSLFPRIASATTSKEAWQALQTQFQGPAKVLQHEELDSDLFNAAMRGDETIFDDPNFSIVRLSRKGVENNNILHIAIRYDHESFVKRLLSKTKTDPEYVGLNMRLICGRNTHGNTPFHVAAQIDDESSVSLMRNYYLRELRNRMVAPGHDGGVGGGGDYDGGGGGDDSDDDDVEEEDEYDDDEEDDVGNEDEERPWRAKNSEGNTALHLSLLTAHRGIYDHVADLLVSKDPTLASIVNNSLQAPLHLALAHLDGFRGQESHITIKLLKAAEYVVSWRDAKGFTPLHRLALLSRKPSAPIKLARKMIEACPQSTLVCDPSGKSFLHLLALNNKSFFDDKDYHDQLFDLICRPEMSALINLQDEDGNTPLHLALKSDNIPMVKLLWRLISRSKGFVKTRVSIQNKDGISASSIVKEKGLLGEIREPRIMTGDECNTAMRGDVQSLRKSCEPSESRGYYNFKSSLNDENRNFFHLLMSNTTERCNYSSDDYCREFLRYITEALTKPWRDGKLVYQMDNDGNTPLHILAQNTSLANEAPTLLSDLLSDECFASFYDEAEGHQQPPLWMMQNKSGNTALHEAIIANNIVFVLKSLNYSLESTVILNNCRETPLHLLAGATTSMEKFKDEQIMKLIEANSEALRLQDINGLIPMSRAVKAKNVKVVVTFLCNFQEFRTNNGQSLWQIFLQNHQTNDFLAQLLQKKAFRNMLEQKNKDVKGNTPLHIAIQNNHFGFVRDLLETCGNEHEYSQDNQWLMELLKISNNLGQTSEDLLADFPSLSKELEEKLLTDHRMRGIRSSWKIPRTQLQNYMSSMNVIAALQTTITFTAAFTVPGGLNQDKGTPILIDEISFQVFMISDVIAMCLSMMVLICLLWMVATDKRKSVMIQDFALTLLLLSFVATILTFMAGIYAFIYPVKPWMAITTLVLCSLLMLFLPRRVLTNVLLHFKYPKTRLVKKMFPRPASSRLNTQQQRFAFDRIV